jgi:hypothetical protein
MYDVVYLDDGRRSKVLATGLTEDVATTIARDEAKARKAARMFRSGSEPPSQGHVVLIVESSSANGSSAGAASH